MSKSFPKCIFRDCGKVGIWQIQSMRFDGGKREWMCSVCDYHHLGKVKQIVADWYWPDKIELKVK